MTGFAVAWHRSLTGETGYAPGSGSTLVLGSTQELARTEIALVAELEDTVSVSLDVAEAIATYLSNRGVCTSARVVARGSAVPTAE